MTTLSLNEHDIIMVRARVHTVFAHECLVMVPTPSGEELVMVPFNEIYRPPASDEAARAARLLVDHLHRGVQIAERAQAEIAEWGAHAMQTDPLGR